MRTAAIDLGTNTFHLIIAEKENDEVKIIYKTNAPVRLGEGRLNDNLIIDAAFKRGVDQLKAYSETLKEYGVTKFKTTGTSAIRSASNGKDFVDAVKSETGIDIEIISGDEEAGLIYQGVKLSGAIEDLSLIMDIGGGSVEFILCDSNTLIWKKSYDIGAARLMQQFFKSDPISDEDRNSILVHIQNQLEDLFEVCEKYQPKFLIGSAGAFETFAELIIKKNNQHTDIKAAKTYKFDFDEYIAIAIKLINATHAERAIMPGMIPLRVDMIVVSALITNYVLGRLKINNLTLSTYDLKMGVLASLMN
ncbi:exopolyphosphatase [Pedobacter punctiformis]|uniref:Exopolyphosphatase n=1 Tax=Pedobacter punctiformis TaxID=3004097 RepID=A0ABT4L933_9SPHI|nr:exopolyphosphatase [Pedobacter sp. HCMS5-2]MCZ4244429.1 exopolyphosphatase [Pedobacter sp. HCMS5-2]